MGYECAAGVSGSTGIGRGRPLSPREDTRIFSLKTVYLELSFTWCLCRLVWHSEIGPFIWKQLWFCCGCSDFSRTEIWPVLIPRRSQNFQPNNQCAPWFLDARPLSLLRLVVKLRCCLCDSDYEMWCGPGACQISYQIQNQVYMAFTPISALFPWFLLPKSYSTYPTLQSSECCCLGNLPSRFSFQHLYIFLPVTWKGSHLSPYTPNSSTAALASWSLIRQ